MSPEFKGIQEQENHPVRAMCALPTIKTIKRYCLPALFAHLLKTAYEILLFYRYSTEEKGGEKKAA